MDSTARHPGDVGDPAQTKAEALSAPIVDDNLGREIAAGLSEGMDSINREGERREVSVLFADLRGFTSFCDTNPVETIFPLLNQFLGTMIKTVTDHGGVVDKIIGDAVMAIFGLRATEDDNAKSQAVECGCEMIRLVFDISTRLPATQNNASRVLGLGVGIATGEVVVGVLGNDRRRSFTVIGHRVNLAARLESQARVGELLIDVETWEGIDPKSYEFELTDLWLKGITRAVPAMSVFPSVDGDPLE
jgi:adenylate cyclase